MVSREQKGERAEGEREQQESEESSKRAQRAESSKRAQRAESSKRAKREQRAGDALLNEAEEIVEPPRAVHVLLLEELLDIRNLHHCLVFWVKLILRGSDVRLDWQGIIRCWLRV